MGLQSEGGSFVDGHRHSGGSAAVEEAGRFTANVAGNATSGERIEGGGGEGEWGCEDGEILAGALKTLLDLIIDTSISMSTL